MKGDTKICPNCGKPFEQRRKDQRHCDTRCRYGAWSKIHPRITIGKGFKIVHDEQKTQKAALSGTR